MQKRIGMLLLAAWLVTGSALAAGPAWQDEFGRLCGGLEAAEALSIAQLEGRVADCKRLAETIRREDAEANKVYLLRLERCRKFYEFMASVKNAE